MKRILFLIFSATLWTICTMAQSPAKYGFLSKKALIALLSETTKTKAQVDSLRSKYEHEVQYNEASFRRLFSEYLQVQKNLPETILLKRQGDLQTAMERSLAFRREAEALLKKTETELMKRIEDRVDAAIRAVGNERGYDFIVDTDARTHPFLNPTKWEDVTSFVKEKLFNSN